MSEKKATADQAASPAPETFAAATVKGGNAPAAPLDTGATGHNGGPCTVDHLRAYLDAHVSRNPGVAGDDRVTTDATTLTITPYVDPAFDPTPEPDYDPSTPGIQPPA